MPVHVRTIGVFEEVVVVERETLVIGCADVPTVNDALIAPGS